MADTTDIAVVPAVGPLDEMQAVEGKNVSLTPLPFMARVLLRGDAADPAFCSSVERVVGAPPPKTPCRFTNGKDGVVIHWTGPDEWMLHAPCPVADGGEMLTGALAAALKKLHFQAVNVSDYYTGVRLTGLRAWEALAAGSPLDAHPDMFRAGHCAGTRYHNAAVLVARRQADVYDIQVRRSFAEYLWGHLCVAARDVL